MDWTWDENKAASNLKKHGVSFSLATKVFNDPLCLVFEDPYPHEECWRTIGKPDPSRSILLLVVHTWPEPISSNSEARGRIISAREVTTQERKVYENEKS